MPVHAPRREKVARAFIAILNRWLHAGEAHLVIGRNQRERHPGICHSHDFYDANQAMLDAFEKCGLRASAQNDRMNALWCAAWTRARQLFPTHLRGHHRKLKPRRR